MAGIQTRKKLRDSRNEKMQEGLFGRCDQVDQETTKKIVVRAEKSHGQTHPKHCTAYTNG